MAEEEITRLEALKKLREPFKENQISKLPKGTKAQNECPANEKKNCTICGGWHHPRIIHLDYVGHAALTDRLLDTDPLWNWEPVAVDPSTGGPALDKDGGMWIRLTICGMTRLGYGDAQGKTGSNATKERIGDALRNAAMRFGAALDLWHKGDLHVEEDEKKDNVKEEHPIKDSAYYEKLADVCPTVEALGKWYKNNEKALNSMAPAETAKINLYVKQLKAAFLEGEKPVDDMDLSPTSVQCPETRKNVLRAECEGKGCRQGCPVLPEKKNKLDLGGVA